MAVDVAPGSTALDTVFAFKTGVVPTTDLAEVTVGRKKSVVRCRSALKAATEREPVEVDFVEGAYGFGKSHFLDVVRSEALSRDFAVATIAANFDSVAMHRPTLVARAISASLELPDQPTVGFGRLLRNLVEQPAFVARSVHLYKRWMLPGFGEVDHTLSVWPSGIYAAAARPELVEKIARWLSGEPMPIAPLRKLIREVCVPPRRMAVNAEALPGLIAGLARSLQELGYAGLVLLIDEAENALGPMSTPSQRSKNARFLHALSLERAPMYVVLAVTPSVALSLELDLEREISPWALDPRKSLRFVLGRLAPDRRLPLAALGRTGLHELAVKIVELHGQAFRWNSERRVNESILRTCVSSAMERGAPTRAFVKQVVEVLELCEQHPHVQANSLVGA